MKGTCNKRYIYKHARQFCFAKKEFYFSYKLVSFNVGEGDVEKK